MTRRANIYERAFEQELVKRKHRFLPTKEERRPHIDGRDMKNFDFIIYRDSAMFPGESHWLAEVKGRKLASPNAQDIWVTASDLYYLRHWATYFGSAFVPMLIFVFAFPIQYWRSAHFHFGATPYQAWAIGLDCFYTHGRVRAHAWEAIGLPRHVFRAEATPVFVPNAIAPQSSGLTAARREPFATRVEVKDGLYGTLSTV